MEKYKNLLKRAFGVTILTSIIFLFTILIIGVEVVSQNNDNNQYIIDGKFTEIESNYNNANTVYYIVLKQSLTGKKAPLEVNRYDYINYNIGDIFDKEYLYRQYSVSSMFGY